MEKKENKKDWILIVAIIFVLISFFLFIFSLNINNFISLETKKIPIAFSISDHNAMNISKNQTVLHLGSVKKGNFASRSLNISNDYNFSTVFEFDVAGDIENLLVYKKQILFEPLEDKLVSFSTKIIEDEEMGDYSGVITVRIKRVPE